MQVYNVEDDCLMVSLYRCVEMIGLAVDGSTIVIEALSFDVEKLV